MKHYILLTFSTLLLSISLTAQQNPNALSFDGINDNIQLGASTILKPASAITFEAWVNKASWNEAGLQTIVSTYGTKGYYLNYSAGTIIAGLSRNNSLATVSTSVSSLTGWHHLSFTFDGQYLRLYVDGALRTSNNAKNKYGIQYTTTDVSYIGSNSTGTSNYFNGTIDEVRFWSIARTAAQLAGSMNAELTASSASLLANFRFNQGAASATNTGITTLTNITASAITGTLNGFALSGTKSNWVTGVALTPVDLSSNVLFTNDLGTQATITWQRAGANKGGNLVSVFIKATSTGNAAPVNGTNYTANTVYSSGSQIATTGWYCIYNGTSTSVNITGLVSSTVYRVHVIEAQNANTLCYNTNTNTTNPVNRTIITPATQASNIVYSALAGTSFKISFTKGSGAKRVVFLSETTIGTPVPVNGTTYSANTVFKTGSQIATTGWYSVLNGTGTTVTVTGLTPGKTYRTMILEYNGAAGKEVYLTTTATNNPLNQLADFTAPTTQATNIVFSNIGGNSFTAGWTRGNGTSVAVFILKASTGSASPVNNTTYTANTNFSTGSQIGSSKWYCVYNGTGTSVTIAGLSGQTSYRVQALEYNGIASLEKYKTTTNANNPLSVTTTVGAPSSQATNVTFAAISLRSFSTSWTRGNGTACAVFIKQTASGSASPIKKTSYTANTAFGSGTQIGTTGWYCIYNGSGTTVSVTGLQPGLPYSVSVSEYSGAAGNQLYNTSVATNNPASISTIDFTIWNGTSWDNGNPDAQIDAQINGNLQISGQLICKNLLVNTGFLFEILPAAKVTVNGNTVNNGKVIVRAPLDKTATGSIITYGSITNTDTMQTERYIIGGNVKPANNPWYFICAPVPTFGVEKSFVGDYVSEFVESTNSWTPLVKGNTIKNGYGYMVKTTKSPGKKMVFTGTFNTGNQHVNLTNTAMTIYSGYNLIANPYPSSIDWNAATGWTKTNINTTIWIWDPLTSAYATWNGTVGTNGGSQYIQPMQAFMVQVTETNATGSIDMTDQVRVHNSTNYLKSAKVTPELIRLTISGNNLNDETVVYKDAGLNNGSKLFSLNESAPQLYVINDNAPLSILKVNPTITDTTIQLGIKCNVAGQYSISSNELSFGKEYDVTLLDTKTNVVTKIQNGFEYKFTQSATDIEKRFVLTIRLKTNNASAVSQLNNSKTKIWSYNQTITVEISESDNYTIELYNLSGTKIFESRVKNAGVYTFQQNKKGIYVVKVTSKQKSFSQKVLL